MSLLALSGSRLCLCGLSELRYGPWGVALLLLHLLHCCSVFAAAAAAAALFSLLLPLLQLLSLLPCLLRAPALVAAPHVPNTLCFI